MISLASCQNAVGDQTIRRLCLRCQAAKDDYYGQQDLGPRKYRPMPPGKA
jgi:hypothetical protein